MADPIAAATGFAGFPSWALLDMYATFGECRNHTTAYSLTSDNRAIAVSFELVDPPKVSRWFVERTDCPGRMKTLKRGFATSPHIVNSSGSFVVMRMDYYRADDDDVDERVLDYFVYNADGPGRPPSLDLIPGPCPDVKFDELIAVLPSDDVGGGEHYSVFFPLPSFKRNDPRPMYELIVFSSADWSWSTKFASMRHSQKTTYGDAYFKAVCIHPSKAMAVGRGLLAWIDLWRGVLLCDGLDGDEDDQVLMRLIEWPIPLPCHNAMDLWSAEGSRDATLSVAGDGTATIRFVRIKFHYSCSCHSRDGARVPIGWTATIWKRRLCGSMERWEKCYKVDISKILRGCSLKLLKCDSSSSYLHLLRKVWDTKSNKLDLNKVSNAPPMLSLIDEDVVYFMTNLFSNEALVIAVNARKKKLEAFAETSFELDFSPCSFSSRLLDARRSGTDDDTAADQSDACADDRDNVDCLVTNLQAGLDELKSIEEHLELRKPWYKGIAPVCSDDGSSLSTLHDVIDALAPCFSSNVHNNFTTDAVHLLVEGFRELGDLKSRIQAPVEAMKNKVSLALAALDTLQNGNTSNDGKGAADAEHGLK